MKKEDFIAKAIIKHGDKYDYSLLPETFKSSDKINIICKKHGVFLQNTGNHICLSRGCPTCGFEHVANLKKKKCADTFLDKARKVHGDKYIYDQVQYVKSSVPIIITCDTHGDFTQLPYSHLSGQGCPTCGAISRTKKQTGTLDWFIEKARSVHGDRYDYSKSVYIKSNVHITITCKKHGDFTQQPNNHLNGNNCPECVKDTMSDRFRLPYQDFLDKVSEAHGDTYELISWEYRNLDEKVKASCKIHGEFSILARHLINGVGCPKCGILRNTIRRSKDQEYYIPLFKEVHGDTYDYSTTSFEKSKDKFSVICKVHGEFTSSVWNHLRGQGCPKCSLLQSTDRSKPCSLYIMSVGADYIKVGISNCVSRRLSELNNGSEFDVRPLHQFDFQIGYDALALEKILLSEFEFGVVEKHTLSSGYTEVTFKENLNGVLEIINSFIPDSSFTNATS